MKHVNEVFSLENTESKTNVNINVTIHDSVTSIGDYAFDGCSSLTTVNYKGTQEQWEQISIDSRNGNLISATINYNYTDE